MAPLFFLKAWPIAIASALTATVAPTAYSLPSLNHRVKKQSQRARVLKSNKHSQIKKTVDDIVTTSSAKTVHIPEGIKEALENAVSHQLLDLNDNLSFASQMSGTPHTEIAWVLLDDTVTQLQDVLARIGAPLSVANSGTALRSAVQKMLSLRPERVDLALQAIANWTFHEANEATRPARSGELGNLIAELLRKKGLYAYREPLDQVVDEFQAYLHDERPEVLEGNGVLGDEVFMLEPQITERYIHLLEDKKLAVKKK